jgi:hypothetical protein
MTSNPHIYETNSLQDHFQSKHYKVEKMIENK